VRGRGSTQPSTFIMVNCNMFRADPGAGDQMSKGFGRTQRECLRAIDRYPWGATTYTIAADAYDVPPDRDGNRMISEAQHVATKRALAGLRRAGLVTGRQDMGYVRRLRDGTFDRSGRAERCCIWVSVPQRSK
jgi:hypothetical protein